MINTFLCVLNSEVIEIIKQLPENEFSNKHPKCVDIA